MAFRFAFIFILIASCSGYEFYPISHVQCTSTGGSGTITLRPQIRQKVNHNLYLKITGQVVGECEIGFGYTDSTFYAPKYFKDGKIDFEYNSDWYADSCYVIYKLRSDSKISLNIDYRFCCD